MGLVGQVLEALLRQVFLGLGPLLALGVALFAVQRWSQRFWTQALGWRGVVYATGWLGTPVHELSHWLVGRLFGVKILEVRPFKPDERTRVLAGRAAAASCMLVLCRLASGVWRLASALTSVSLLAAAERRCRWGVPPISHGGT